ncbi:hypothetical protein [Embleya sp. NBC_00896]|uniref:hypothetical protein n=1 Tax=Embleya sp. NBC_00896 TaxID=2975961 RepID=UPI002F90E57B|nr:hypothetical protein OG928_42085 [Embleya sp. NBC_00896]
MFELLSTVAHLTLAASWMGSMAYSLTVVQPKVASFLPDEQRREEFLVTLAHGNRRKVVGLVAALLLTGVAVIVSSAGAKVVGYAAALVLYAGAAGIFAHVSWRHWPARVFALPPELAGFRRRLRLLATTMLALVGAGFVVTLTVSVA